MKCFLTITILVLFVAGCRGDQGTKGSNLGPEVGNDVVRSEINEVLFQRPLEAVEQGEYAKYEINLRIENQSHITATGEYSDKIIIKEDLRNEGHTWLIVHENFETTFGSTPDKNEVLVRQGIYKDIPMSPTSSSAPSKRFQLPYTRSSALLSNPEELAAQGMHFTYHNLKTSYRTVEPPETIKMAPNCRNIPNCKLRIKEIQFDEAAWANSTQYQKFHYTIQVTADLPLLATTLSRCVAYTTDIEIDPGQNRNVFVNNCVVLRDLRWNDL